MRAPSVSTVALVPAAGRGERLGADRPKALVAVHGMPLVVHAVRGLLAAARVQHVVVAAPPSEMDSVRAALAAGSAPATVVAGGADRTASVRLALAAALSAYPDTSVVLVHDAARAFTPVEVIDAVAAAVAAGAPAVVPVLPVPDTVKLVDQAGVVLRTPERAGLRLVQTPQGFTVDALRAAHADPTAGPATDDAGLAERAGIPVATVPGHQHAMKITTRFDLAVAESVLA